MFMLAWLFVFGSILSSIMTHKSQRPNQVKIQNKIQSIQ